MGALDRFSPATRDWFHGAFPGPTPAQEQAWAAVSAGGHTLVVAPTGSGKTLAAFLWALDRLATAARPDDPALRCRVLYVSPLKALAVDVERNLRDPLAGIQRSAQRLALPVPDIAVAVRSGDTPPAARRDLVRRPPDVLITTPESLFLLLTSAAREVLRGVGTVIVDEVHAVAGSKRGAHLAVSLERLDARLPRPAQRIGLSATVRPVAEVARFLGGSGPVTVVAPPGRGRLELQVAAVTDLAHPEQSPAAAGDPAGRRTSVWPALEERLADLVAGHRSTIVFANSRRLAERLTSRLNDIASDRAGEQGPVVVARSHHGSVSRHQRAETEAALKAGHLPAVVATSSLELGIDMGAVDLVVQVESPPSVASGLQRVGRAGHQVGEVSRAVILPVHPGDLLQATVVAERMAAGAIEALRPPQHPLDVLAQQVVAMCALDDWTVDGVAEVVRRAAPFADLPERAFLATLDMLAGRYPSDEFAELRPRITWDRAAGALSGRRGAQRLAVTSGGTIPDRGLFGVFLAGERPSRVGELDEEMVYESRVGEVFLLGSSAWRIEAITADRVLVSPAPGQPGKMPFWKGDTPARPLELGRAVGAFVREVSALPEAAARERLGRAGLDRQAADTLRDYLAEQRAATGRLPDDRTVVVERFRDELGDWRLAVHSPFGAAVHQPWALALVARLRASHGVDVHALATDDGIMLRLPETSDAPPTGLVAFEPDELERAVHAEVGGSTVFAARFRECAARALLLPRRQPTRRTPLWQQRQRAAQLLAIASRYPSFPITLEAMREVLQDVFDLPGLLGLMGDLAQRRVELVEVDTVAPSPFARSLLRGYLGAFVYDGDTPLADRRAQALAVDSGLLAELLGRADLDPVDPHTLAEVAAEAARLVPAARARDRDDVADLLRVLGDLTEDEVVSRGGRPEWLVQLEAEHRAVRVHVGGQERWLAAEDLARVRDALGASVPEGVPAAFLEPVDDPLGDLVARFARTHGPFRATDVADRLGLGVAVVTGALEHLEAAGRVTRVTLSGEAGRWCDVGMQRALRRRSLARLRRQVEPVPGAALARFLPEHQEVGRGLSGTDGLLRVVEQMQGVAIPASALESLVLPARVAGYRPALLDELTASGEVLWAGRGALPGRDGYVALYLAESADLLLPTAVEPAPSAVHAAVLEELGDGAALFFRALADRLGGQHGVIEALWDLVWAARVTNDTLAPVRARLAGPVRRVATRARRTRVPVLPPMAAGRWSALPAPSGDPTRRAQALAQVLLDRHGVLTRDAALAEGVPGGFAGVYPVLRAMEEAGRVRRGYFVAGLGAAQFALPGCVERLRSAASHPEGEAAVLAATDPANPYGGALPWPEAPGHHRPGRKAGAVVVLVSGALVLYLERGGRTLVTFPADGGTRAAAMGALAGAARSGVLGRLTLQTVDGQPALRSPLAPDLQDAGFGPSPRGLRLRA